MFPTAVSGSVLDGVLRLEVDTSLECTGDRDSTGFSRSAVVVVETDEPWESVAARDAAE